MFLSMSCVRASLLALVLVVYVGGDPVVASPRETPPEITRDRTEISRRAHALAGDLMSPFCPGRTLADCPSPSAGEWRDEIRTWVAEGLSDREIRARLQARVPETDLSFVPRSRAGWILPGVILGAGFVVVLLALNRAVRPRPVRPVEAELDPSLRAEIEREIDGTR